MAKLSILKGATSVLVRIFIQDSSSTTGAGLTGLVYNTSNLTCYRARDDDGNAGGTVVALATATLGTWATKGFKEKDATNMPGVYEFGLENAALAAGSRSVTYLLKGATNMAPLALEIELTGFDNQSVTDGGLSKLTSLTFTGAGKVDASVRDWVGDTIPARNVAGVPLVDAKYLLGTIFATPATAGIPDINVKNWVNGAVPAVNVTGVPLVDLKYTLGTISPAAAGSVRADAVTGAVGSVTAAVATTSNIKKNQALAKFQFIMTDSTNHLPAAGKTVTCTRSIDGGAFAAGTLANVAEVSTAVGTYTVDFGAGDLNGNVIVLRATASSSDDTFERITTTP